MMKFERLSAFVAVADSGSISAAAQRLGLSKSVVSERLAELERELGTSLIQRTTRKMSLTGDGSAFLQRARRIIRDMDEAVAELAERRGSLIGPLRLSAPVSFGSLHLGPALYPFLRDNPDLQLTLELDDRFVDVTSEGYDAVIRHGAVRDARLIAKRLASSRPMLVAAPAYLQAHGAPRTPEELENHSAILYSNRDTDWRFAGAGRAIVVRPGKCLRVNNGLVMRDAALAGLGITLLPSFMIGPELADGTLQVIDLGLEAEGAEVYLVYPLERGTSAKLRTLIECLREAFGDPPYWEAGLRTGSSRPHSIARTKLRTTG
jgi:DNA-binding transcriptional LysR family regulator